MLIVRPNRWTRKPTLGTEPSGGHQLANGLLSAWLFNESAGKVFTDQIYNQSAATVSAAPTWGMGPVGPVLAFASQYFTVNRRVGFATAEVPLTIMARVKQTASGTQQQVIQYGEVTDSNAAIAFGINTAGNVALGTADNFANVTPISSGLAVTAATWTTIGCSQSSVSARTFFANGQTATNATNIGAGFVTTGGICIGTGFTNAAEAAALEFNGSIDYIYVWKRALTISEMMLVYTDPWSLWAPQSPTRRLWIPTAAAVGGGTRLFFPAQLSGIGAGGPFFGNPLN